MKELRVTKMVEQTTVTFIANDGKEFENEKDCAAYERRLNKEKCAKEFRKLNATPLSIPFTDWSCNIDVYKVTLNNEGDIDIVADYFVSLSSWYDTSDLYDGSIKEYPCTKILVADESWVGFSSWTPEDVKRMLTEAAEKL